MRKTIYACDRCGKEVGRPCDLETVQLPARLFNTRTQSFENGVQEVELCRGCWSKFWQLSDRLFARVEVSHQGRRICPQSCPSLDREETACE